MRPQWRYLSFGALFVELIAVFNMQDARRNNELSFRDKMLNTNISMLGRVKSTLFGSTSQHSPTKLDDKLKDLPEPIESRPLLFTCC